MNTIIQFPQRLASLKISIKDLRKKLSGADEDTLRMLNDMEILLNLKDTEPIDKNWDGLFYSREEERNDNSTVKFVIDLLRELEIDGEHMEAIINSVGMGDQMLRQLVMKSKLEYLKGLIMEMDENKIFLSYLIELSSIKDIAYSINSVGKTDDVLTEMIKESINKDEFFLRLIDERKTKEIPHDIMQIHIQGFIDELIKNDTLKPDPSGSVYMITNRNEIVYCTPFWETDKAIPISYEELDFNYEVAYGFPKTLEQFDKFKGFYKMLLNSLY